MLVADVLKATVEASGVSREVLIGPSCLRIHARPRQVGIFLSYRLTAASNAAISRVWGGRDRTTVRHAVKAVDQLLADNDPVVVGLVTATLKRLGLETLPTTRPVVVARPLLLSRIAAKERELARLRADLAAFDATHFQGTVQ